MKWIINNNSYMLYSKLSAGTLVNRIRKMYTWWLRSVRKLRFHYLLCILCKRVSNHVFLVVLAPRLKLYWPISRAELEDLPKCPDTKVLLSEVELMWKSNTFDSKLFIVYNCNTETRYAWDSCHNPGHFLTRCLRQSCILDLSTVKKKR